MLSELYTGGNRITSLGTIAERLPKLDVLDASSNRLPAPLGRTVATALAPLSQLRELYVEGNPCSPSPMPPPPPPLAHDGGASSPGGARPRTRERECGDSPPTGRAVGADAARGADPAAAAVTAALALGRPGTAGAPTAPGGRPSTASTGAGAAGNTMLPRPATGARPGSAITSVIDSTPADWVVALSKLLPQIYVLDRFVVREDAPPPIAASEGSAAAGGASETTEDEADYEAVSAAREPRPVMRPLSVRSGLALSLLGSSAKRPEPLEDLEVMSDPVHARCLIDTRSLCEWFVRCVLVAYARALRPDTRSEISQSGE